MSVTQFRTAYLPSGTSSTPLPFASQWTDTSGAQNYTGVWDTPSGSADSLITRTTTYTGAASSPPIAYVLAAQIIFPAFGGSMPFVAPPGTLGWVSFDPYPTLLSKFTQSPASPIVGVQTRGLLRVFKSDNTLRTQSRNPSASDVPNGALLGRLFQDFPEATPTVQVFATDYLVVELGFRLASFSPTTFTVNLDYQLGDGHAGLVTRGSSVDANAFCKIRWFSAAGSPPNASGGGLLKAMQPSRKAEHFQYPPVADRDSSILNEFILNGRIL